MFIGKYNDELGDSCFRLVYSGSAKQHEVKTRKPSCKTNLANRFNHAIMSHLPFQDKTLNFVFLLWTLQFPK